ncbi:5-oxoprolinase subunit PxpB [Rhizobium herbae]|uniref:KipI family sensor histidine kinase inhibitor n=1 Tax=Rhizobium herbae TaxID=508661 RepID=A0ABS4EPW1_9HYPH|nr:5-oxoprolinase subunit PxpB [Rhizobium herbae]MBP1859989.1 KipI family sensor histidine kinase inhibitor [Rhizobium herbae]
MEAEAVTFPRIVACGDSALSVELSDRIDEVLNDRVIALAETLTTNPLRGVEEVVPTYRSLMVVYDPSIIRGAVLTRELGKRLRGLEPSDATARRFTIPVVYGGQVGLDLEELAAMKGLTPARLVELHSAAEYRVYMIGFAPGFAYLGGLPDILHTPRLEAPRQRVEAGAIGIGGKQASINSVAGPSGWRFIGRTPLRLFDPDRVEPFLLRAGDRVRFRPVGQDEAAELDGAVAAGRMIMEPA